MSDKDPVREQIEMDAEKYSSRFDYDHRPYACEDYDIGASKQDPIAWNRCLDEVNALSITSPFVMDEYIVISKEELEKLRR